MKSGKNNIKQESERGGDNVIIWSLWHHHHHLHHIGVSFSLCDTSSDVGGCNLWLWWGEGRKLVSLFVVVDEGGIIEGGGKRNCDGSSFVFLHANYTKQRKCMNIYFLPFLRPTSIFQSYTTYKTEEEKIFFPATNSLLFFSPQLNHFPGKKSLQDSPKNETNWTCLKSMFVAYGQNRERDKKLNVCDAVFVVKRPTLQSLGEICGFFSFSLSSLHKKFHH